MQMIIEKGPKCRKQRAIGVIGGDIGWLVYQKALGRGPKGQSECAYPLGQDAVMEGIEPTIGHQQNLRSNPVRTTQ